MQELTKMQQKIYEYIAACIREQGYPPSVREIGEAVGLRSPSTVHFHLKQLEEAGVIEKGAGKGRGHHAADGPPGRRKPRCRWWATWRPAARSWQRSASRTI